MSRRRRQDVRWARIAIPILAAVVGGCGSNGVSGAAGQSTPVPPTTVRGSNDVQRVDIQYRIVAEPVVTGTGRYGYQVAVRLDRPLPEPTGGMREQERYTVEVNGATSLGLKPYPGRSHRSACYRATFENGPIYASKPGQRVAVLLIDFGPRASFPITRITKPRRTVLRRVNEQSRAGRRLRKRLVDAMGCR